MKAEALSRMLHTHAAAMIMAAVAAIYLLFFSKYILDVPAQTDFGTGLSSNIRWHMDQPFGTILNIALNALIIVLMVMINKIFNVLRSMTWMMVGLFVLMQAAVPYSVVSLNSGSLVCCVMLVCLYLMFQNYGQTDSPYGVFTTFLLLSAGATMQYCFVFLMPLMWIICMQMRIFNLRNLSASLMGMATVWIILLGFGLVEVENIGFPAISNIFSSLELENATYLLVVVSLTAFLLIASILLNVFKTMAYNAQSRSYNGALTILSIVTILAMVLNYNNIMAYLPLLNCCAAYQITHYFVNHRYERQFIGVFAVIGVYILLYAWRIIL